MYGYACLCWCSQVVPCEVCHPGHVQDASQGLPGLFSFNWVDQWMMTRLNGFNLDGSSQRGIRADLEFYTWFSH